MNNLDYYNREMKQIAQEAGKRKGVGGGLVAWLMMLVGVPMLWKRLYDTAPDSMMKVAVLEAEAALRSQLVEVEREQNALMISAYREAFRRAAAA